MGPTSHEETRGIDVGGGAVAQRAGRGAKPVLPTGKRRCSRWRANAPAPQMPAGGSRCASISARPDPRRRDARGILHQSTCGHAGAVRRRRHAPRRHARAAPLPGPTRKTAMRCGKDPARSGGGRGAPHICDEPSVRPKVTSCTARTGSRAAIAGILSANTCTGGPGPSNPRPCSW